MHWLVVMFVSVCYLLNNSDTSIQGVWGNWAVLHLVGSRHLLTPILHFIHLRKKQLYVHELLTVVIILFSVYNPFLVFVLLEVKFLISGEMVVSVSAEC